MKEIATYSEVNLCMWPANEWWAHLSLAGHIHRMIPAYCIWHLQIYLDGAVKQIIHCQLRNKKCDICGWQQQGSHLQLSTSIWHKNCSLAILEGQTLNIQALLDLLCTARISFMGFQLIWPLPAGTIDAVIFFWRKCTLSHGLEAKRGVIVTYVDPCVVWLLIKVNFNIYIFFTNY